MYNVVSKTLVGPSKGGITWTSFKGKEDFDAWNDAKMKEWYQVVEEGVSQERAVELCSTPKAHSAVMESMLGEIDDAAKELARGMSQFG